MLNKKLVARELRKIADKVDNAGAIKYVEISNDEDEEHIRENRFYEEERYKSAECTFDPNQKIGYVEWVSQESEYPSDAFIKEIKRAYMYNFGPCTIKIKFCSRDNWGHWNKLTVRAK